MYMCRFPCHFLLLLDIWSRKCSRATLNKYRIIGLVIHNHVGYESESHLVSLFFQQSEGRRICGNAGLTSLDNQPSLPLSNP